jgi:hypothetical protein
MIEGATAREPAARIRKSNVEVEEEIAKGRSHIEQRIGATKKELRQSRLDVLH